MSKINWAEVESTGNHFKDYAPHGVHKVIVAGVKHHETSTGSIAQDFIFAEDDQYKYPKVTHWLSFNNNNWRLLHNRSLMELLGASRENAERAIEICEDKTRQEDIIKAYQQAYERLIAKKPEVEIETWADPKNTKYSRADFTASSVRMDNPDDEPYEGKSTDKKADDIMKDGEEIALDKDLPF